jgi:hypothetical protein
MNEEEQRVLSVSYGSFSVRLDGFDDPFAIMRRVTEYFRSVASLDPSFGMKPLVEDLAVFEAMETAVFDDDIQMEANGSTLTLRPQPSLGAAPTGANDVFVLSDDIMAEEPVLQAPLQTEPVELPAEATIEESADKQAEEAATPLDLQEMAQNHLEMPFVGAKATKPQEVNVTSAARQVAEPEIAQDVSVAFHEEQHFEAPTIDFDEEFGQVMDETFMEEVQEAYVPEDFVPEVEEEIVPEIQEAFVTEVEEEVVPEFETAEMIELPEVSEETSVEEYLESTADQVKSPTFRSLTLSDFIESQAEEASEPVVQDLQEAEVEPVEAPVAEKPAFAEIDEDYLAKSLDQEPVQKRPLRIIRNNYAFEEPEDLEQATAAPTAPKAAVNPFRKFPKRDAAPAPVAQATAEVPVQLEEEDHSDLIRAYRKLKAEHG